MVDPIAGAGQVSADIASNDATSGTKGCVSDDAAVTFDEVLEADVDAGASDTAEAVDAVSPVEGNRLTELVESIQADRASLEATMDRVMSGQDLDQKEMLEMQALVYQYSQRVELTSKVVEKATGGLKQMLNMQV
jgi:DNA-binding transcriptional regulator YbjK